MSERSRLFESRAKAQRFLLSQVVFGSSLLMFVLSTVLFDSPLVAFLAWVPGMWAAIDLYVRARQHLRRSATQAPGGYLQQEIGASRVQTRLVSQATWREAFSTLGRSADVGGRAWVAFHTIVAVGVVVALVLL